MKYARDIAVLMGIKYKNMFAVRGKEEPLGYGLGGGRGNQYLASSLVDKVTIVFDMIIIICTLK